MALGTSEGRVLGLAKEAARGTAEAAPDRWRAISLDSELEYSRALIEDDTRRGISARFPAAIGTKTGTGTIKFPTRASEIGEFLHMALGNPVSALDSTSLAYKHTFTAPAAVSSIQPQSYTAWLGRQTFDRRYALCNVSELTFSGDQEGLGQMEAAMMFKTEDNDAVGTPSFASESEEFTSYQAQLKFDTVKNAQVKTYNFAISNGLFPQRTLNCDADIKDLLAVGPHRLTGTFDLYLEDATERTKFLDGTQTALELLLEGDLIEDTSKYTLQITAPKVKYRAFPLADLDGLLGASVEWEAEYDTATSKLFDAATINQVTAY